MKGLSKSRYTAFCQCPRMMWINTYEPDLKPADPALAARFKQGDEVGDLAMTIFGDDFVDVTTTRPDGSLDLTAMIKRTREEMESGREIICEASFSFNGNYCAVDILRRTPDGWNLYEVKSSTFKDDEKDNRSTLLPYSRDIAYQKWVLEKCGLNLTGTYLVRLDSNYVRRGELDVKQLFHITDMKEYVGNEYDKVASNVSRAHKTLEETSEPQAEIGPHCRIPYDCGYFRHCVGELPEPNVFDLYRMNFDKKCNLFHEGRISFEDLRMEDLSEMQRIQVETYLTGKGFHDPEGIRDFLGKLTFPLYFLDFETMQPVLPLFDGTHPYQHITFQYSLHWLDKPESELHHTEYLGNSKDDPRRALAEQLCRDIPRDACVTAFNKAFECTRLKELAGEYPDLAGHLLSIRGNIVDLLDPFRGKMHYLPVMNGSFSIKKVLPALFPDDPKLNYANLQGSVHNGGDAMYIYPAIARMEPEEAEAARRALLDYCCLDTLAMVRIYEKLKELSV